MVDFQKALKTILEQGKNGHINTTTVSFDDCPQNDMLGVAVGPGQNILSCGTASGSRRESDIGRVAPHRCRNVDRPTGGERLRGVRGVRNGHR